MRYHKTSCLRRWGAHVFFLLIFHFKPHVLGTSVDDWYVTYNNRALTNVITTRHVSSRVACCSECTSFTGCISADFDQDTGICGIGTENPVLYPTEMTSEADSTVFVRGKFETSSFDTGQCLCVFNLIHKTLLISKSQFSYFMLN